MKNYLYLVLVLLAAISGCGTDAESPVTAPFLDSGYYSPEAGETFRYVDSLRAVSVIEVPKGIGGSSLLKLGEVKGIRYSSILMDFDFDSIGNYEGRTVDSVILDLPVITVMDTLFHLQVTFNELTAGFTEEDTITVVPPYDPNPIMGAEGETVRDISIERTQFSIEAGPVQDWIDGTAEPWEHGIAINWFDPEPDTLGLIEMNAQNRGTDPPVLKVIFDDGQDAVFPVRKDYAITRHVGDELAVVGGTAQRLFFEFDLDSIPEDASIHYSALVLNIDGSAGLGATVGEILLGLSTDFYYYLYTPETDLLEGTGVARDMILTTSSGEVKIPLGRYTIDIAEGEREKTGLVLQSDLENVRIQKLAVYDRGAEESLRPYIEVYYSMPSSFQGER
jgi:uncharacterized protein YceK